MSEASRPLPAAYPPEKAREERRNHPASYLFYRPVSLPIARLFVALRISANQATVLALLAALTGLGLLASGSLLWGAIALNVACILDQVDGNIARSTGSTSRSGSWLDALVGYLYNTFALAALALGLAFSGAASRFFAFPWEPASFALLLGFTGSAAIATRKAATSIARDYHGQLYDEAAGRGGLFLLPKVLNSFSMLALLVAVLAAAPLYYLAFYALFQLALVLVTCLSIYRALSR